MNLWFSGLVLALGLIVSSSAVPNEECKTWVKPKLTFAPMYKKMTFILGYSDNPVIDAEFRSTQSHWLEFKPSPTGNSKVIMESGGVRHPTYCRYYEIPINIIGNSGISRKADFTYTFHSLPTCPKCLLYYITAINSQNLMKVNDPTRKEQLTRYNAFFLMSEDSSITKEELEHAKKQAECLGFSRDEPTFEYSPSNPFCDKSKED